ncbi:MAG: HlyD family efflux transporter periplasmic adaptor subunit, partial [Planctomycetota bacterium]
TVAIAESSIVAAGNVLQQFATWFPDHTIRIAWGRLTRRAHDATVDLESVATSDTRQDVTKETVSEEPIESSRETTGVWSQVAEIVIDHRLGRLEVTNSIHQRLASQWVPQSGEPTSGVTVTTKGLLIDMTPLPESSIDSESAAAKRSAKSVWQARIWITPPLGSSEQMRTAAKRMHSAAGQIQAEPLQTLASILFGRPKNTWLRRIERRCSAWWAMRRLAGVIGVLCLGIALFPVHYRVDAVTSVRARDARVVAAPFDATLLASLVQPGDSVTAGQALLELDGRPMRIELQSVSAEWEQAIKDEDIALAAGKIAEAQLASLRRQTLASRRELIQSRLDQLIIRSPINGIIIQGDLQRHLGSPLTLGQTLIEVAPRDSVELELEIPEPEIGFVEANSPVRLWFPAIGGDVFETQVQSLWPAATVREDQNVFVARAPLPAETASANAIRVGMKGEAVLSGPLRPWTWSIIRTPLRRLLWILGW